MRLLHFIQYQFRLQFFRKRWFLPIPLLFFLTYRAYNYFTQPGIINLLKPTNAWDLLFLIFGNRYNIYFAIGLLYLYLVCDLLPETDLGQLVLIRLQSRKAWWAGKTLTLLILTLIYVLGSAILLSILAGLFLPWQSVYSEQAQYMPESINLPMNFFRAIQPPAPIIFLSQELTLLILGLFGFGMVILVVNQIMKRYYYGLLAGCVILFFSMVSIELSGPPPWAAWLPGYHLTYLAMIPIRTTPLLSSYLYWAIWISIFWIVGFIISLNQDHSSTLE